MAEEVSCTSDSFMYNTDINQQYTISSCSENSTSLTTIQSMPTSACSLRNTAKTDVVDTYHAANETTHTYDRCADTLSLNSTSDIYKTCIQQQPNSVSCEQQSTTTYCNTTNTDNSAVHTDKIQPYIAIPNTTKQHLNASDTETETTVWDCTSEELQFMTSCTTDISNTQTHTSPLTTQHVSQCTPKTSNTTQPMYIFVKTENQQTPSTSSDQQTPRKTSKKRNISTQDSQSDIDLLQMKIDCLFEKVEHVSNWTEAYLRYGDTRSAIQELTSLRENLVHSKISLHETCAKVRQQLH